MLLPVVLTCCIGSFQVPGGMTESLHAMNDYTLRFFSPKAETTFQRKSFASIWNVLVAGLLFTVLGSLIANAIHPRRFWAFLFMCGALTYFAVFYIYFYHRPNVQRWHGICVCILLVLCDSYVAYQVCYFSTTDPEAPLPPQNDTQVSPFTGRGEELLIPPFIFLSAAL